MKTLLILAIFASAFSSQPFVSGQLMGQLGNQFFQIATTCAVAWDHGAEPCFPDHGQATNWSMNYTHLFFRCSVKNLGDPVCEKGGTVYGYEPFEYVPNMKIAGYFQNEKYFAHHRKRLLELFAPHPNDLRYVQRKYRAILEHPKAVSVHLRYYYAEKPEEETFVQYEREYFEKAMALFPTDSLFVVTSDNLAFARQNIPCEGRRVIFIEKEPYYIDFLIQRLCQHHIISNSSFSWWSAWLSDHPEKIIVRPKIWLAGYPDIGGPEEWIRVEAAGLQTKLKR